MEATIVYRGCIGIMENKIDASRFRVQGLGFRV